MKKLTTTLLAGSVVTATLLFTGCGTTDTQAVKAPKDTTKLIRGVADDHQDWTWFVGIDGTKDVNSATFTTYFMQGVPNEVQHFQYFLDTDNNAQTGFSFGEDSWRISGADILVEDGEVYKSQSTTEWKWSHVGSLDNYTRSKVNGVDQIDFAGNKTLLGITSDTINVTIEPFDANWGSTYSTISTQAVTLVTSNDFPERWQLIDAIHRGMNDETKIKNIVLTPQKGGVIVHTSGFGAEALKIYGLDNPWEPKFESNIVDEQVAQISDIKMLSGGKIEYTIENDGKKQRVEYDYFHKKIVSTEYITSEVTKTIEKMLNKHTGASYYNVSEARQLDTTNYLVFYTVEYNGGGDGHSIIAIFSTETQKVLHTLSNQNLDGGPGTNKAFHINIDKGTNTLSYDREMKSVEPFYSYYAPSILHTTYNYENGTSETYRGTDDATWNKIRGVSMKNFRGLPLKQNGIFLLEDKAYVLSHRGATYYFTSYDMSGAEIVLVKGMPETDGTHVDNIHMDNSGHIVYTIKSKNTEVTYNPTTKTYITKQI